MAKKFGLHVILFAVVLFINIYVANALVNKMKKAEARAHILAEIDHETDPQKQFEFTSTPFVAGAYESSVTTGDARAKNLKQFFRKYNSDLYDYAEFIVETSDKYQFDYRLLPAIAMQESTLCKFIPENSYNCWGWGIYGDLTTRFSSYEEGIETVAQGLKKYYIDEGYLTASAIMEKYTPPSKGSWARGVNTVLGWLE
jgi:hypothetical protein